MPLLFVGSITIDELPTGMRRAPKSTRRDLGSYRLFEVQKARAKAVALRGRALYAPAKACLKKV